MCKKVRFVESIQLKINALNRFEIGVFLFQMEIKNFKNIRVYSSWWQFNRRMKNLTQF